MGLVHMFALDSFVASGQRVPDHIPVVEAPVGRDDTDPDGWDAETLDEIPEELEIEAPEVDSIEMEI